MENSQRSERTREAIIQAALTIIARDGPAKLTLDAIARESGVSKGGLTHQFRSKKDVLQALIKRQIDHFESFSAQQAASGPSAQPEANLRAQIATLREATIAPGSAAFALLGAAAEDPELMQLTRQHDQERLEAVRREADDPDLATLRWMAATGLMLSVLLRMCPLEMSDVERLFERLLDPDSWTDSAPLNPAPDR